MSQFIDLYPYFYLYYLNKNVTSLRKIFNTFIFYKNAHKVSFFPKDILNKHKNT